MNRRKFLRYLGIGTAAVVVPLEGLSGKVVENYTPVMTSNPLPPIGSTLDIPDFDELIIQPATNELAANITREALEILREKLGAV